MKNGGPSGQSTRRGGGRAVFTATAAALTTGALCAGIAVTALPAYADVTSSYYTIGTPSGGVSTVVATPANVDQLRPHQLRGHLHRQRRAVGGERQLHHRGAVGAWRRPRPTSTWSVGRAYRPVPAARAAPARTSPPG